MIENGFSYKIHVTSISLERLDEEEEELLRIVFFEPYAFLQPKVQVTSLRHHLDVARYLSIKNFILKIQN